MNETLGMMPGIVNTQYSKYVSSYVAHRRIAGTFCAYPALTAHSTVPDTKQGLMVNRVLILPVSR